MAILISFFALALIFMAIILVRAAMFKPHPEEKKIAGEVINIDSEKIAADLSDMIRCKTVSHRHTVQNDAAEYEKFHALLEERFPLVHKTAELKKIGNNGLLYFIKGRSDKKPSVCMAHYDVVPAEEKLWSKPAFEGLIEDGMIWGRGALDTKGTLCGLMTALEKLLSEGYVPENDLYFSFSGEEEVDGTTCADIVEYFAQNGIRPDVVLDEGGAVVDNVFPGYSGKCALIGIAEKGGYNLEMTISSNGGHSSTPPPNPVTVRLCKAVCKIQKHPFPRRLTKPVLEMFDTLGRHSTFLYKIIFANLWCFSPLLDLIAKRSGGEINAMLRTTVAVTRLKGSNAYNVLPPIARLGMNVRLMETETVSQAIDRIKRVMGEKEAVITVIGGTDPSPCSETKGDQWDRLKAVIEATWPDAIVSPYLMMACSDSRHFCRICDRVYRFSPMHLSDEERAMIHGNDERVPIDTMVKTAAFYVRLLKQL